MITPQVRFVGGGKYYLSLVTIVIMVNHKGIGAFHGFLGHGTIGHEVAWHAARGTHSRHRLGLLVWLVRLAGRTDVHPRRNEVFVLELISKAGQRHELNDALRAAARPSLGVPNRPEPPMIHHVLVLR